MAQYLYFSRDTKVYIEIGGASGYAWEVPVLDGFSFSQATNSSEIVLAEMESAGGVSRRGKRMFNDNLAPAEWSFTTYTRPFLSGAGLGSKVHAVEEVLWALMAGPAEYDAGGFHFEDASNNAYFNWATDGTLTIDWGQSNKSTLGTANIWFRIGDGAGIKWYKIAGCVVNEATIDFDIDGIASINWSGMGNQISEESDPSGTWTGTITEANNWTTNFIRNRLTQLTVVPDTSIYPTGTIESSYDLTLTGGSITVSNNITYITPEELGIVNYPIGHVTGNRSVSGNFTCYVVWDDGASVDDSADFWADMATLTSIVTHKFALDFYVGGSAGDPRLQFSIPTATIEIPTHSIEDIISLETNFSGLPSTIDATDEMTVSYYSTIAA